MDNKTIKITFQYPEYEGENVIADRECIVKYEFDSVHNKLTVSVEGQDSVMVDKFDDLDHVSIQICSILPDDINDLGEPITLIEHFIINGLLKGSGSVNLLNNSIFTIIYEPTFRTTMTLSSGKVLNFPMSGSEYLDMTMNQLL